MRKSSRGQRGQGIVEFTLVLPVLLIILLIAIDAGRLFYGYVGIHNATRIAANYAATHPDEWPLNGVPATDPPTYVAQITRDTASLDCDPNIFRPTFGPLPDALPRGVGDEHVATVTLTCVFHPLTPIIGTILGDAVTLSATETFPIRAGALAGASIAPVVPTPTPTLAPTPSPVPTPTPSGSIPPPSPTPGPGECIVPTLMGEDAGSALDLWTAARFQGTKLNITIPPDQSDYVIGDEWIIHGNTETHDTYDGTFQNCNAFALNVGP